jgi:uncharacterized protein with ATP-grasp and redox domains
MKSDLECLECLVKQGLNTIRLVTSDEKIQRNVLDRIAERIPQCDLNLSPAFISKFVYDIVSEVTGLRDPYQENKKQTNEEALNLLPKLEKFVREAADPLIAALHIAVAGNIIDLGIGHEFDLENDVVRILNSKFIIDDTDDFKRELIAGRKLMYIGDNSGEIVFDRIFVQELLKYKLDILFVVKSGPVINDATLEDARVAGITDIVPVIGTGSDDIGINFDRASEEFLKAFNTTDLVLAKGQGNFETLEGSPQNTFFLLKTKCNVIARELGVKNGEIVFKHQHIGD